MKKTKKGDLVFSEPERQIANWLYDNKIRYYYEKEPLFLGNYWILPDFYLPKYKLYIEYYGQWRYIGKGLSERSRQKEQLYKRYKIKHFYLLLKDLKNLDKKLDFLLRKNVKASVV